MSKIKLGHLADSHLRHQQWGYARRSEDFFTATMKAVTILIEEKCDAILHGGDVLDASRPGPIPINQLRLIDELLRRHNMPMYIVSGNHDYSDPSWIASLFNQEERIKSRSGIIDIGWRSVDVGGLTVAGVPGALADVIRHKLPDMPPADVLLAHVTLAEDTPFAGERTLTTAELRYNSRIQLMCLGDLHRTTRRNHDGLWVTYPGSAALHTKDEDAQKYVMIHTFDNGKYADTATLESYKEDLVTVDLGITDSVTSMLHRVETKKSSSDTSTMVVSVKYDPSRHNIATVYSAAGGDPRIIVLDGNSVGKKSKADVSSNEPETETTYVVGADEQLPKLVDFFNARRVGVESLDAGLHVALTRNANAPELVQSAVARYIESTGAPESPGRSGDASVL